MWGSFHGREVEGEFSWHEGECRVAEGNCFLSRGVGSDVSPRGVLSRRRPGCRGPGPVAVSVAKVSLLHAIAMVFSFI